MKPFHVFYVLAASSFISHVVASVLTKHQDRLLNKVGWLTLIVCIGFAEILRRMDREK